MASPLSLQSSLLKLPIVSSGYTHVGFGALQRVNGLGLVQLRFHVTIGDAVAQ